MDDIVKTVFSTPIPNLLILVGLLFLTIAIVGRISGKIDPGNAGRIAAGVIGGALLVTGRLMHLRLSSSPAPSIAKPARILEFSADPPTVAAGKPIRLCYGVADARSARIEPGVGEVKPVERECLSLTLVERTSYTLTAMGLDSQPVRREVTVEVTPAPAPPAKPSPPVARPIPSPAPPVAPRVPTPAPAVPPAVSPPPTPPPPSLPARNDIRNFRATDVSNNEVQVTVDYTYTGNFGASEIPVGAAALQGDGNEIPGLGYRPARAKVGDGTATLNLYADLRTGAYASTTIRVCLVDTSRRTKSYCETFPYRKTWLASRSPAATRPNDIRNFRAVDVSDTDLQVTVDYAYDGSRGAGLRYIYMAAIALQSDGSQVPRTDFVGLGGPGEVRVGDGTTTMLIKKSGSETYTSTAVRVCLVSNEPYGQLLCKLFRYTKLWR